MQGLSAGEVLDAVVLAARHAGLLVMFDLHHLAMADGIGELWYDNKYSEARVIQAWTTVVQRCAKSQSSVLKCVTCFDCAPLLSHALSLIL